MALKRRSRCRPISTRASALDVLVLGFLATGLAITPLASGAAHGAEAVPAQLTIEQAEGAGGAQEVISAQIDAFKAGEHERAFGYAAPGIRRMFGSTSRFIGIVKSGYMPIYGARSWTYGRSRRDGTRLFQEVLLTGPSGRQWVALYTMDEGSGVWKIAGVRIVPGSGRTT